MRSLDLDQLRTFVVVADLRSFTAAGDCLNATQSAVSLRIAKLEGQVGRALLTRTPRAVSLTPDGTRFLDHARTILAAHDAALTQLAEPAGAEQAALRLAVSDHAVGAGLAAALSSLKASLPGQRWDVTVGLSAEMRDLYDDGGADAAIVRQDAAERRTGEPLFDDPLCWAGAPGFDPSGAVPLVAMRGPCGVTAAATGALDAAGRPWRFAFLGGSVLALQAAVRAGLGVAALGRRHVPAGAEVVGDLPDLPLARVVLHTRLAGPVRRALAAAFRAAGG